MSLRLSLCLNSGARCGKPQAAVVVVPEPATLLKAAVNKLRLSKKDQAKVRFFVWSTGHELLSDGSGYAQLKNGDMVAISFGESYAGPVGSTCHHALPFESAQAHAGGSTNGSSNGSSNDAAIDGSSIGPADPPRDAIACDLKALGMVRWESVSASLAIVEWSESSRMNASLGRMRQASVCLPMPGHIFGLWPQFVYPCLATFLAYGHSLFTHAWPHFWPMATVVWPQCFGHSVLATVLWPQGMATVLWPQCMATVLWPQCMATVYGPHFPPYATAHVHPMHFPAHVHHPHSPRIALLCSTFLEHPTHSGAAVVSAELQRTLPSSGYLGHNLYSNPPPIPP